MTIVEKFKIPSSLAQLDLSNYKNSTLLIAFISGKDSNSGAFWCPDVRATLPTIQKTFVGDNTPDLALAESGPVVEWKTPSHPFRTNWNVNGIPTLVRYEIVDGKATETARLTDREILDSKLLSEITK